MISEIQEAFQDTEDYLTLNEKQKEFFNLFFSGKNIFLSGGGGVGKSYCLQVLFKFCEQYDIKISKTASTGSTALNIGGQTIHSWLCVGIADKHPLALLKDVQKSHKKGRIESCKILVIDEVSMLSKRFITILDFILRKIRKNDNPFGGVQLIFTGDFLQLPPVGDGEDGCFAFESPSWQVANITTHVLTESVRQKEADYANALIKTRIGDYSLIETFRRRLNKDVLGEFKPLKVFPHKASVDKINFSEMEKLPAKPHTFNAVEVGKDHHLQFFEKNCQAKRDIILKIGAQVSLVSNIDVDAGLVNGSFGKIVGYESNKLGKICPVVQFSNKITTIVEPYKYEINEEMENGEYRVAARRTQIPLKLAWAGTSHSCQGLTVDAIEVDLNRIFGYGMGYVVLSRCKTLDGMKINCFEKAFGPNKFQQSPKALDFYAGL